MSLGGSGVSIGGVGSLRVMCISGPSCNGLASLEDANALLKLGYFLGDASELVHNFS